MLKVKSFSEFNWKNEEEAQQGISILLSHGMDVDFQCKKNGLTALMYAVQKKYKNLIDDLLKRGADPAIPDQGYDTALSYAIEGGNADIVRTLVRHGADVNAKDDNQQTPLIKAASLGHVDCIKVLVRGGARVNEQNTNGKDTAVHAAIWENQDEALAELINLKADLNLLNDRGMSPLECAIIQDSPKMVSLLLKSGADIEDIDNKEKSIYKYLTEQSTRHKFSELKNREEIATVLKPYHLKMLRKEASLKLKHKKKDRLRGELLKEILLLKRSFNEKSVRKAYGHDDHRRLAVRSKLRQMLNFDYQRS